ncbi:putative Flp pilus-assembly TadE/G-like protein [Panacagrimonas perspica]|uniref:Putative Flp pilus-assembly TadE/G-like protein n=1 Tax=Panacagrimonas perspica TaxID=381431 RepID=A0A4S3KAR6_9GAMM|nr:Tad domain-containing protein [Panacagrimonas perspica]TDU32540.1 putative Flp pilus-assembly TadE/G-like protein [Panacagrimonas perspica]THD05442.1 hypothetical protein B1810_01570 [Panacagrimonas perspica]
MSIVLPSSRAQAGQIMPMTAVFIVVVLLALWVMYDSGELMSDKVRLQNTADNVAYSTAALVSRDLNFIAYTNRGMVANQIGIAQMVGLSSWAASIEQFAVNMNEIGQAIPYVGAVSGAAESAATAGSIGIDLTAERVIPLNERVIEGLSDAQRIFHQGFVLQLATFGRDIARGNDPDAYSLLSLGGASLPDASSVIRDWNRQIGEQYRLRRVTDASDDGSLDNRRYRDFDKVVQDSRDRFSSNRSYRWPAPFTDDVGGFRWRTRKYGGTEFLRSIDPDDQTYRWDWAAMETVSLYAEMYVPISGWETAPGVPRELPLAWGAAHALDQSRNPSRFHDYGVSRARRSNRLWGNGAWRNANAARLLLTSPAYSRTVGGKDHVNHNLAYVGGLREFYELRDEHSPDGGPAVIALYVKDEEDLDSQNRIIESGGGTVAGNLDTDARGGLIAGRIGAVAKAQPYYARPTDLAEWQRSDRRAELGNLYNPYWQPRLVDLSDAEKATATAIVSDGRLAARKP